MLPVIDVENGRAYRQVKPALVAKRLKEMINYIEDELHVKPIIYTNASFWNKQFGPYFKDMNNNTLIPLQKPRKSVRLQI